jgi:hypothetical protein
MLKKLFSFIIACAAGILPAFAQELNCKIVVMHDKITGVDAQVFTAMQRSLNDFMNTHKWTTDDYGTAEKIDCNILIALTGRISGDDNGFSATLSIQSTRPVYNSSYTSPIINYVDRDVAFDYSQFSPLQFDDNRVSGTNSMESNLTALLAYYSYMIIALDYDSFAPLGGTVYLKKAQNVVNNAPENGNIKGWKAVDGTHNRYWLTDQLLNTRFQDVRSYWYTLHREGLDNMYTKPDDARNKIFAGVTKLSDVNKENPGSLLIQFFFNAKGNEMLSLLSGLPKDKRGPYITMLSALDVPNAAKYNSLK